MSASGLARGGGASLGTASGGRIGDSSTLSAFGGVVMGQDDSDLASQRPRTFGIRCQNVTGAYRHSDTIDSSSTTPPGRPTKQVAFRSLCHASGFGVT
ncbi:hypothetical protein GCM10010182_23010 [Actinomadura cremea]|nr:hypothetical protein GCM10010182_23010 [Actinomadura cremea]